MVRRMVAEMPLSELFDWFAYHIEQSEGVGQVVAKPSNDQVVSSVESEIAYMRALTGG